MVKFKCRWNISPNLGVMRPMSSIDTIVIHATERGSLYEVEEIFRSVKREVSAHFTIARDGSSVCHVPIGKVAWHAGKSHLPDGRESVNQFSIGIELLNKNDGLDPYSLRQLASLRDLLNYLCSSLPISILTTHRAIAQPIGRKTDPVGLSPEKLNGVCVQARRIW